MFYSSANLVVIGGFKYAAATNNLGNLDQAFGTNGIEIPNIWEKIEKMMEYADLYYTRNVNIIY